jgi:hypothetical protein
LKPLNKSVSKTSNLKTTGVTYKNTGPAILIKFTESFTNISLVSWFHGFYKTQGIEDHGFFETKGIEDPQIKGSKIRD